MRGKGLGAGRGAREAASVASHAARTRELVVNGRSRRRGTAQGFVIRKTLRRWSGITWDAQAIKVLTTRCGNEEAYEVSRCRPASKLQRPSVPLHSNREAWYPSGPIPAGLLQALPDASWPILSVAPRQAVVQDQRETARAFVPALTVCRVAVSCSTSEQDIMPWS